MYHDGDFSFIHDASLVVRLTYDFKHCFSDIKNTEEDNELYFDGSQECRRSSEIDREKPPNVWDTPPGPFWKKISRKAYPYHNEQTYKYNMKLLCFIAKNGWDSFVQSYQKKEYPFF